MRKVLAIIIAAFLMIAAQAQERLIPLKYIQDKEKPTLVMFTASWCGPCKYMKESVMKESNVKKVLDGFNVLLLDVDQNDGKFFSERFIPVGYKGSIPYFAILDKSGKVIDTLLGSVKQKEFIAFLSKAEEEK